MVIKLSRTIFLLVQNKFSNQIAVYIGNDVLGGYFSSMGTKLVFMKELKHQFHLGKETCIYISSSVISRMCLLLEDINKLEKVQRTMVRYVTDRHRNISSGSDMLSNLKWRSLANRTTVCLFDGV